MDDDRSTHIDHFRAMVESGVQDDGFEPVTLWRIPIYLRSRQQFYAEWVRKIREKIDRAYDEQEWPWGLDDGEPMPRQAWEQYAKRYIDWIWYRHSPPWWGANDVVGWIEVLACVRDLEISANLCLPKKRISRQLERKVYWFTEQRVVRLQPDCSNESLQEQTIAAVNELAQHPRLKKLCLDLDAWRLLAAHTDLYSILCDASIADGCRQAEAVASDLKVRGLLHRVAGG